MKTIIDYAISGQASVDGQEFLKQESELKQTTESPSDGEMAEGLGVEGKELHGQLGPEDPKEFQKVYRGKIYNAVHERVHSLFTLLSSADIEMPTPQKEAPVSVLATSSTEEETEELSVEEKLDAELSSWKKDLNKMLLCTVKLQKKLKAEGTLVQQSEYEKTYHQTMVKFAKNTPNFKSTNANQDSQGTGTQPTA